MSNTLNNQKVALITGAGRRVGAAIANTLHAAGMNIVVHYNHSVAEAKQLCAELNEKRSNSAVIAQAELSHLKELEPLVKEATQAWGRLDILVNNASRFYKTSLEDAAESAWDDLINSNLKAPFFLAKAAAKELTQHHGCIVNIADIHAERPMPNYSIYCISKAGLVMLTKSLADELGPTVRVNAVSPGAVDWPEGENTLSAEQKEKIMQKTALHRHGTPMDIAKAVLFLVRDAEFVTGHVLAVDGGRVLAL